MGGVQRRQARACSQRVSAEHHGGVKDMERADRVAHLLQVRRHLHATKVNFFDVARGTELVEEEQECKHGVAFVLLRDS